MRSNFYSPVPTFKKCGAAKKLNMAVYLEKGKISDIFVTHNGSATDTGSVEGQVALFTYRIAELSKHLQTNKKDNSCRRSLLALVGQRKRSLTYLYNKDVKRYRAICEKLGIRHV